MLKLMGKKIFTIYTENICLPKNVPLFKKRVENLEFIMWSLCVNFTNIVSYLA